MAVNAAIFAYVGDKARLAFAMVAFCLQLVDTPVKRLEIGHILNLDGLT